MMALSTALAAKRRRGRALPADAAGREEPILFYNSSGPLAAPLLFSRCVDITSLFNNNNNYYYYYYSTISNRAPQALPY